MSQRPYIDVFILLLLCCIASSQTFDCPDGPGCSGCNNVANGEYEIFCRKPSSDLSTTTGFLIRYIPNEFAAITCINSPDWDDFHLGETMKIQHIDAIYFKMCELPKNYPLSIVVKKLVVENVDELDFRSYDNLTTTLSRSSLNDFHGVKKLTLSSNSLANVSDDLLNDLPHLQILNIQENNLNDLPENFLNIPSLLALELSNNKLKVIETWDFEKLGNLRLLNLWNNKLIDIKPHSFDKLTALASIDLQNNELTKLSPNIFSRLLSIGSINLSKNNFSVDSLPDNLLRDNSNLDNFKLFDNKQNLTTLPNKFFGNLTKLRTVNLRRSGLLHLPEDLFSGAVSLNELNIARNYLKTLSLKFFQDCKNLKTLDMSFNDFEYLSDGIFVPLRKLDSLDLSMNRITTVTMNLLSGLSSLTILNMEYNGMKHINHRALESLKNLQVAKFSHNQLTLKSVGYPLKTEFGFLSPFQSTTSIEELHLAYNNITEIFSDWRFANYLNLLDLKYNKMQSVQDEDFRFFSSKIDVDLRNNEIETILLKNTPNFVENHPRDIIIHLENNPIKCDCNLYNVLRFQEGRMSSSLQNAFDLRTDTLKCHDSSLYPDTALSELKSDKFVCELDQPELRDACPTPCSCLVKPETKAFLIDCSNKGLLNAPRKLQIPPNLQSLHVELNLSGNYLSTMPSIFEPGYDKVQVLDLIDNNIEDISLENLSENLVELHLESNNLTRLNSEVLTFFQNSTNLKALTLHDNSWNCDCEARDFLIFIQTKRVTIPELQKVTCGTLTKPLFEMTPEELCPVMIEWIIGICIGIALLGIIVGCIASLYYRYQSEIKVWLYAHQCCLCLVTEEGLDKDKLYDAFISYSHKDDDFVMNHLVPKLEQDPNSFKLCVHYRDWLAGEWIPTQIVRSVDDSRRTIVVLSPNFIESIWGRMEFRAAHKQALSEGRARLIVILYGDIGPTEALDPELKSYLSMNTYIKWGDPWFWEKLRYALPHPTDLSKRKTKKQSVFQTYQPKIQLGNDKSELINSNETSRTSSTSSSTPPYNSLKTVVSIENEISKNALNNALTKDLNGTIKSQSHSEISSNNDQAKCNGKINVRQCTNV